MVSTKFARKAFPRVGRGLAVGALALSAIVLSGCANQRASGKVYNYNQAQREQAVRLGTVVAVNPATIQGDRASGIGAIAGGVLGGVASNAIGGGKGRNIVTVGGALLGSLAGNVIENKIEKRDGFAITVELDKGGTRVITQEADIALEVGQRVQVVGGGNSVRVLPL